MPAAEVRRALAEGAEIGLLDVRPEARYAEGHPLFAASLPLDRLEIEVLERIPRAATPLIVYGGDDHDGTVALGRLRRCGYRDVALLAGGLAGWVRSGGELFRDVHAPSKAFGELVAEQLDTPAVDPLELRRLLDAGEAVTVLDARRYDEYRTMSIPSALSAPGATLVGAVAALDPGPDRLVVVNCAGRTRSIIGAQSLLHAGVARRVAALRNGTIGWSLAGLDLDHDRSARAPEPPAGGPGAAAARRVAERAGVGRLELRALLQLLCGDRTVYRFDVRSPEAFERAHLAGFRSAPGGQLVQETDRYAPVRGAVVVLADDGTGEADMTASWLAQMGWDARVLDGVRSADGTVQGPEPAPTPPPPVVDRRRPDDVAAGLADESVIVLDVDRHAHYLDGHLAGAVWASRAALRPAHLDRIPAWRRSSPEARPGVVVTSHDDALTAFAVADLAERLPTTVAGLLGGTPAWRAAGRPWRCGPGPVLHEPLDRYRRPYEGTDVDPAVMQAYLDWEYGLVDQLGRDGTHRFRVLAPDPAAPHPAAPSPPVPAAS